MKYLCLIPSFNEEKTIGWLTKAVKQLGFNVIVIDDGSKDNTARFARESGAEVIVNERNLGKGSSLRKAFALLSKRSYDAVIILDGDGQHLPADIHKFIECYEKDKPGIIVGNRMLKSKGMPFVRWLTNKTMSFFISKKCGQNIADSQCGFRLIAAEVIKKASLFTENFEIESEMLLDAARNGFTIASVPIATIYEGQASAIHPVKDTIRFFKFLFKKR